MKKSRIFGYTLCALLGAASLSSCLDNDNKNTADTFTAQLPASMNFSAVKDLNTNDWAVYPGAAITLMYDFNAGTVGLVVSSMQVNATQTASFSVPSIPIAYDKDGAFVASTVGPYSISLSGTAGTVSDIRTYLRIPENCPSIIDLGLTINDRYKVTVVPVLNYFSGTTFVRNTRDNTTYSTERTYYNLQLDNKTMTAELFAFRVRFAENMPELQYLSWANIPFSITDSGIVFSADNIIPNVVTFKLDGSVDTRTPRPEFACTDLTGSMTVARTLNFNYKCTAMGDVSFTGTPLVKYEN